MNRWTSNNGFTEYPLNYKLTWSFTSKVDYYEPNNTLQQAAEIPLNSTVEAFMIAGVANDGYFISSGDDRQFDWYKITLDEATNLTFDLLQTPSDARVSVVFHDEQGDQLWFGGSNATSFSRIDADSAGALINANLGIYPAGTYYISVRNFSTGLDYTVTQYPRDSIPDHFDTPYKFRITTSD